MAQNVKYKELPFLILPQNFLYQKKLPWGLMLILCFWLLRVELSGLATPWDKESARFREKNALSAVLAAKLDNLPVQRSRCSAASHASGAANAVVLHEAPLCPKSLKA